MPRQDLGPVFWGREYGFRVWGRRKGGGVFDREGKERKDKVMVKGVRAHSRSSAVIQILFVGLFNLFSAMLGANMYALFYGECRIRL